MVTKVGFPGSSVKAYRNYIFGYINYSYTFHAKSMEILLHDLLKTIKIDENRWKSVKIHKKSWEIHEKSCKILKNLRNSMKINENHEIHNFCNTFHAKIMKILLHYLLKTIKIDENRWKSMKIHEKSWEIQEDHRKSMKNHIKSIEIPFCLIRNRWNI